MSRDLVPVKDAWKVKYTQLKKNAGRRGIKCLLTFEEYMRLAKKAGISSPDEIGRTSGKYQMSRRGDAGNYVIGNCRFLTIEENLSEKVINGGTRSHAEKIRGRTAKTHPYLADLAKKKRGRTAETHEHVARSAAAHRGRTKHTHEGNARQADALSKTFKVRSPEGKVHKGKNLTEFCRQYDLDQRLMSQVCLGNQSHHKGWTGAYT